jgi:hypothetical protein
VTSLNLSLKKGQNTTKKSQSCVKIEITDKTIISIKKKMKTQQKSQSCVKIAKLPIKNYR